MLDNIFPRISPDYIVYIGTIGVCFGLLFLITFLYRRLRRLLSMFFDRSYSTPGVLASIRNLVVIILWSTVFGMLLFLGYFLRAYHIFTLEEPIARVQIFPSKLPQMMKIKFTPLQETDSTASREFIIKGDQWALEGDILKWDKWLNFVGLKTRYRFTRIRGRYTEASDEIYKEKTIHALVKDEDHYFWRYLYQYGDELPFVSTVYGNAVFQYGNKKKDFLVFINHSGFIVRENNSDL